MTTYLNVLRAGKPYIYDVQICRSIRLDVFFRKPLTIVSIAFLWAFFLGGFIASSGGPRFVCGSLPGFTSTPYLDTGCTEVLAKSEVSPSDVVVHYWIFSHTLSPSQWECCGKGEEVRSLREPCETGFMTWQNEHPSRRSRDHQINAGAAMLNVWRVIVCLLPSRHRVLRVHSSHVVFSAWSIHQTQTLQDFSRLNLLRCGLLLPSRN